MKALIRHINQGVHLTLGCTLYQFIHRPMLPIIYDVLGLYFHDYFCCEYHLNQLHFGQRKPSLDSVLLFYFLRNEMIYIDLRQLPCGWMNKLRCDLDVFQHHRCNKCHPNHRHQNDPLTKIVTHGPQRPMDKISKLTFVPENISWERKARKAKKSKWVPTPIPDVCVACLYKVHIHIPYIEIVPMRFFYLISKDRRLIKWI